MNTRDIDKLEAGRELDALVAEYIFGWRDCKISRMRYVGQSPELMGRPPDMGPGSAQSVPKVSTDIAAFWQVVEHMLLSYESFVLKRVLFKDASEVFSPEGLQKHINRQWSAKFGSANESEARTAQLAGCRAALKAVMEKAAQ
jgi:Phage ABA sandwich domain